MSDIQVSEEIRRNFHLFWDNYPAPVMLVHKDRTIVEANKAGQEIGYPVGTRCVDIGEKEHHAGCRANVALREQAGMREVGWVGFMERVLDAYWIPLAGAEDLYVHFHNDITDYASERLIPGKCESGSDCCSCSGE